MKTEVGSFHVGQLNVFGGWVGRQLDANFGSSGQAGFKIRELRQREGVGHREGEV